MVRLIPLFLFITHFLAKSNANTTTSINTTDTTTTEKPEVPVILEILKQERYFVDKTGILQVLFGDSETPPKYPFYFITLPSFFGKTINLNMIKKFAQIEVCRLTKTSKPFNETEVYDLFNSLKIGQNKRIIEQHLARYPVISLDLPNFNSVLSGLEPENVLKQLQFKIADSIYNFIGHDGIDLLTKYFKKHGSTRDKDAEMSEIFFLDRLKDLLLNEDRTEFALYMLTKIYYQYFNKTKVIILISKYDDTAFNFYKHNKDEYCGFLCRTLNQILGLTFELGQKYIHFAVITSTSALSYSLASPPMRDMITHYPFLEEHRFIPYFGFTENDLEHLFAAYKCNDTERTFIKDYYKAYQTTGGRLLYHPYFITEYFKARKVNYDHHEPPHNAKRYHKKSIPPWKHVDFFLKNRVFREKISILMESGQVHHPIRKLYHWDALYWLEQLRDQYENSKNTHVDTYFTFYFELGLLSHTNQTDVYCIPNNETRLAFEEILRHYHDAISMTTTRDIFNITSTTLKATS